MVERGDGQWASSAGCDSQGASLISQIAWTKSRPERRGRRPSQVPGHRLLRPRQRHAEKMKGAAKPCRRRRAPSSSNFIMATAEEPPEESVSRSLLASNAGAGAVCACTKTKRLGQSMEIIRKEKGKKGKGRISDSH